MSRVVDFADQRLVITLHPAPVPAPAPAARRRLLRAAVALPSGIAWAGPALLGMGVPRSARAHAGPGRVDPPLPAAAWPLTLNDGRRSRLPAVLAGRATALQLMFTGCTATCPIQGALFAAV